MPIAIRRKFGRWLFFSIILMGSSFGAPTPVSSAADGGGLTDYDQQALYLVKFGLSWAEWPTITTTPEGVKIINICIVGDSPGFTKSLINFQTKAAAKLKINITQDDEGSQLAACNIVYIQKNKANFKDIIINARHLPVLTVSPIQNFAASGGIVELAVSEVDSGGGAPTNARAKVTLIINNKAASAANIKIAPELLESAAEVIR